MQIDEVHVVYKSEDKVVLQWGGSDGYYGNVSINYDKQQKVFVVDAELISLDNVLKIIKLADFDKIEKPWWDKETEEDSGKDNV